MTQQLKHSSDTVPDPVGPNIRMLLLSRRSSLAFVSNISLPEDETELFGSSDAGGNVCCWDVVPEAPSP